MAEGTLKRPRGTPTGTTPQQEEKRRHRAEAGKSIAKRALSYGEDPGSSDACSPQDEFIKGFLQSPDVIWAGEVYQYTIPSFDVITVRLRHVELVVVHSSTVMLL